MVGKFELSQRQNETIYRWMKLLEIYDVNTCVKGRGNGWRTLGTTKPRQV